MMLVLAMSEAAESCAEHPGRSAKARCTGCGKALCKACKRSRDRIPWCGACLAVGAGNDPARDAEPSPPGDPGEPSEKPSPNTSSAPPAPLLPPAAPATPLLPPRAAAEPPGPAGGPPPVSPALLALVLLQAAATLIAAWSAWRVSGVAERLQARPPMPPPAITAATPAVDLRAPSLDLRPGTTLRGAPVRVQGEAPFGEIALILIDGHAAGATLIEDGRFALEQVPIEAGEHEISVKAMTRGGIGVESARVFVRYEPAELPTPAPSPAPALPTPPAALESPSPRATPEPTRASLLAPAGKLPLNVLRGRAARHLALTFDGGSDSQATEPVLDALAAKSVRSTLFLTGEFILANPELVRRMVAEGHEIGNHTWAHPHLADWVSGRGHVTRPELSSEILLDELRRTRELFEQTTASRMSRYWRAPYGEVNNEILRWAAADGWVHVGWTEGFDTLDWVADISDRRYRSARQIRERLLARAREDEAAEGGIVLMHLGVARASDQPVDELPRIIDGLRGEGYRLVTVSALLGS